MVDEAVVMYCFSFPSRCLVWFTALVLATSLAYSAQLQVSWDDNATGETGFKIERSIDGTNFTLIGTVGADVTTYVDTTVVCGTAYYYRVAAFNATTTSGFSNVATGTAPLPATLPVIVTAPVSQIATAGSSVTLAVSATGVPAPTYQWAKAGVILPGACDSTLTFASVQPADAGTYAVVVSNAAGSVTSSSVTIIVNTWPVFTQQPVSLSASIGASASFSVSVTGSPLPTLQWRKDGVDLPGATAATLNLANLTMLNAGSYSVVATNAAGSVVSSAAALTVVGSAPVFTTQPLSQSADVGASVAFSVSVTGVPAPTLQWRKDGVAIAGATSATLALANVTTASAGAYSVVATNSLGATTSASATLSINYVAPVIAGEIQSVSARAVSAPWGSAALQLNFAIAGGSKTVLLRAIGPGLSSFITDAVFPDPVLQLTAGTMLVASNDNWGGTAALVNLFMQVGAFPLSATSKDSALVAPLSAGTFMAAISGKTGGTALAEIYSAETDPTRVGRLISVTARGNVGKGSAALTVGFVIGGDTPRHLLLRAIGPSLTGLQGLLSNPRLDVYCGSALVGQNDNWGGTTALTNAFRLAGAASLSPKSKDAAIELTLAPGVYSAVVSGVNAGTGLAQWEIYELP